MSFGRFVEIYQYFWMLESHSQQRLAWQDAEEARHARARAEAHAAAQLHAMLIANPADRSAMPSSMTSIASNNRACR